MWVVTSLAVAAGLGAVVVALLAEPTWTGLAAPRGPVEPDDLLGADLPLVSRGYDTGAVDALLARAAVTIEGLRAELDRRPPVPDPSGEELEDGGGDGSGGLDR